MLSAVYGLYEHLFSKCANGKVPAKKFDIALEGLHTRSPIYHSGDLPEVFIPVLGVPIYFVLISLTLVLQDRVHHRVQVCL